LGFVAGRFVSATSRFGKTTIYFNEVFNFIKNIPSKKVKTQKINFCYCRTWRESLGLLYLLMNLVIVL
jgi:hypothetical protein